MIITLAEYERIYGVIHSVLKNENADTNKACSLYNTFGACILSEHYKIPAKVYSGFAVFHLGDEHILGFGAIQDKHLSATTEEFHTWIEVDGWFIDFMAPEFPNVLTEQGKQNNIPRKMMQKKITHMADSLDSITRQGDYMAIPDKAVTESIMSSIESKIGYIDLMEICNRWYNKKPKKMPKTIGISDEKGQVNQVLLDYGSSLVGAW